jgi:hypothetical protein
METQNPNILTTGNVIKKSMKNNAWSKKKLLIIQVFFAVVSCFYYLLGYFTSLLSLHERNTKGRKQHIIKSVWFINDMKKQFWIVYMKIIYFNKNISTLNWKSYTNVKKDRK